MRVSYCDVACQMAHRKAHKNECKKWAAETAFEIAMNGAREVKHPWKKNCKAIDDDEKFEVAVQNIVKAIGGKSGAFMELWEKLYDLIGARTRALVPVYAEATVPELEKATAMWMVFLDTGSRVGLVPDDYTENGHEEVREYIEALVEKGKFYGARSIAMEVCNLDHLHAKWDGLRFFLAAAAEISEKIGDMSSAHKYYRLIKSARGTFGLPFNEVYGWPFDNGEDNDTSSWVCKDVAAAPIDVRIARTAIGSDYHVWAMEYTMKLLSGPASANWYE